MFRSVDWENLPIGIQQVTSRKLGNQSQIGGKGSRRILAPDIGYDMYERFATSRTNKEKELGTGLINPNRTLMKILTLGLCCCDMCAIILCERWSDLCGSLRHLQID